MRWFRSIVSEFFIRCVTSLLISVAYTYINFRNNIVFCLRKIGRKTEKVRQLFKISSFCFVFTADCVPFFEARGSRFNFISESDSKLYQLGIQYIHSGNGDGDILPQCFSIEPMNTFGQLRRKDKLASTLSATIL